MLALVSVTIGRAEVRRLLGFTLREMRAAFLYTLAVLVTFFLLLARSVEAQSPSPPPSPSLEQPVSDLEKRVQELEEVPWIALALKFHNPLSAAQSPPETPRTDQPLALASWEYKFKPNKEWAMLNCHVVTYVLRNTSGRPIKLIEGSITFTDLLGEKILTIDLHKDVRYQREVPASTNGEWYANASSSSEMRMTTLAHDDITATLTIDRAVFGDNTIWSAQTP